MPKGSYAHSAPQPTDAHDPADPAGRAAFFAARRSAMIGPLLDNVRDFLTNNNRSVRFVEYWLGLIQLAWGTVVMLPAPLFSPSNAFRFLLEAPLSETLWGGIVALLGLAQLLAVLLKRPVARRRLALTGFLLWTVIGGSLLVVNPGSTGWVVYFLGLGTAQLFSFLRLSQRGGGA